MADGQLKLSRRALLGVACASAPLLSRAEARHSGLDPESTFFAEEGKGRWTPDQACPELSRGVRGDDLWNEALALFNRADAAVTALEGTSDDDAFNAAADLHDRALERLLLAPAPSVAALARKLSLARRDQAWELPSGDALMHALEQDAFRLAGG